MLTPNLFVDSEPTADYWVDVALPSGSGYSIAGHNEVPEEPNAQEELHIEVRVQTGSGGTQSTTVDIGTVEIDPEEGYIVIHLLDDAETEVGGQHRDNGRSHRKLPVATVDSAGRAVTGGACWCLSAWPLSSSQILDYSFRSSIFSNSLKPTTTISLIAAPTFP